MNLDVQSRDAETAARLALHQEAEVFNAIITSWPSCVVAQACGYRPWRYTMHTGGQRRTWRGKY
jgi:hypothetical protein